MSSNESIFLCYDELINIKELVSISENKVVCECHLTSPEDCQVFFHSKVQFLIAFVSITVEKCSVEGEEVFIFK